LLLVDDVNSNDSDVDGGGVNAIKAMIGGALNSVRKEAESMMFCVHNSF